VQFAGGDEGVDARARRPLQRLGRTRDVAVVGAGQRADGGLLDGVGDGLARPRSRRCWTPRKPASITSTRSRSSWRAMRSFSSRVIEAPGDCSPSRKVVSKMMSLSVMVCLREVGFASSSKMKTARCFALAGR
jgi:hypothetical protein